MKSQEYKIVIETSASAPSLSAGVYQSPSTRHPSWRAQEFHRQGLGPGDLAVAIRLVLQPFS